MARAYVPHRDHAFAVAGDDVVALEDGGYAEYGCVVALRAPAGGGDGGWYVAVGRGEEGVFVRGGGCGGYEGGGGYGRLMVVNMQMWMCGCVDESESR